MSQLAEQRQITRDSKSCQDVDNMTSSVRRRKKQALRSCVTTLAYSLLQKPGNLVDAKPIFLAQISHDVVGELCVLNALHLFRGHVQRHHGITIQRCINAQFRRSWQGGSLFAPELATGSDAG